MKVSIVSVWVKENCIDDFISATIKNHEASVKEKGNLRFDVLRSREDTCKFTLYEAYDSDESADAHKNTEHYLIWKKTVADMMAKPRDGLHHDVLAPLREGSW